MSVQNRRVVVDPRNEAQRVADDEMALAAETGDWNDCAITELCDAAGARQIVEHRMSLDPRAMLVELTRQPFRWKNQVFRILQCEIQDGVAHVAVSPACDHLVAELKCRIETNRFHVLPFYQGFGFIALPEDHSCYE